MSSQVGPFVEIVRRPVDLRNDDRDQARLQELFPGLGPVVIEEAYRINRNDYDEAFIALEIYQQSIKSEAEYQAANRAVRITSHEYLIDGLTTSYDHPNERYCPDLFEMLRATEQSLPMSEPTFFLTTEVPDDWEDLYGEPASTRDHVYAFVKPNDPDSMKFYSSEELVSSFTRATDFVDPGSKENHCFNKRQISRLLELITDDDSVLESVICEIQLAQNKAIQEMIEMNRISGFKDCLDEVLKIGMLMRGWSGEGDYPLLEDETRDPIDQVKLTESLLDLKKRLETDWIAFRQLRLMAERDPSWRLADQTLWERLIIVLDAEQDDSCIRMTSTLFLMTVWFCLGRFFDEHAFDLSRLDDIF